jgi:hypothetical protein
MGLTDVGWMGRRGGPRIVNNWNAWICSNWIASAVWSRTTPNDAPERWPRHWKCSTTSSRCARPTGRARRARRTGAERQVPCSTPSSCCRAAIGGVVDVFDRPVIAEQARFLPRMHLAGSWFANFGGGAPRPDVPAGVVYRYGRHIGDADVTALGAEFLQIWRRQGPRPTEWLGRTVRGLEVDDEARRALRPPARAGFTWLPHDEVMVARDAASSTSGFAVAARGGHNGLPTATTTSGRSSWCSTASRSSSMPASGPPPPTPTRRRAPCVRPSVAPEPLSPSIGSGQRPSRARASRPRAITRRWISLVPSPMIISGASR